MLINTNLIFMKGTGNMGIRLKSIVLLASWGSLGNPRRPLESLQMSKHQQKSSREKQGRWLSKRRKGKERKLEAKTLPRWKERHCKGLVQNPRGAPATPGAAQPA